MLKRADLDGLPVSLLGELLTKENVVPYGSGENPRLLRRVADSTLDLDLARTGRDLAEQGLEN